MEKLIAPFRIALGIVFIAASFSTGMAQDFDWVRQLSANTLGSSEAVTIDGNGNVIVVGRYRGTADLDPGPGVTSVITAGQEESFIQKLDSNGQLLWAGTFVSAPASDMNFGKDVKTDANGNIYIVGGLTGAADFDMGPGIDSLSIVTDGIYITSMDAAGNHRWARVLEGTKFGAFSRDVVAMDADANLYLVGRFDGSVDFDPGPGTHVLTSFNSQSDAFFAKYDSTGNLVWVAQAGNVGVDQATAIDVDADGITVAGLFSGSVDFDPSPATYTLTDSGGSVNLFIARYTVGGALTWATQIDVPSGTVVARSLRAGSDGMLYISGVSGAGFASLDLDPGPGTYWHTTVGSGDAFVIKLDTATNFKWARTMGSIQHDIANSVAVDPQGSVYLSVNYTNDIDMDPGLGIHLLPTSNPGFPDIGIVKLDSSGAFIWAHKVGGPFEEEAFQIEVDGHRHLYAAGSFEDHVDFDPSPVDSTFLTTLGGAYGFVFRWGPAVCGDFVVRIDSVSSFSCANASAYLSGSAHNGTLPYAYSWNTIPPTLDSFATVSSLGIYTLTATDAMGCESQSGALVEGPSTLGIDLEINVVALRFRPGLPTTLTVDIFNTGCQTVSGVGKLVLDPQIIYVSASPAPQAIVGDTLFWNLPPMNWDSAHFIANVYLETPQTAQIGDTIRIGAIVTPIVGDQEPLDNVRVDYEYHVVSAIDPNHKSVFPVGACAEHYALLSQPLTYTIQFQNTGNAEALEVAILDTLDPMLDLSTLAIKGTSHPMITEILPGNVVRFAYHNIHLPDSNANEPASHGYVIYEIRASNGIASGTEVHNGSAIYFDFNPPVITNTVMNTLVSVIPACAVQLPQPQASQFLQVYPNPATTRLYIDTDIAEGDLTVVDMLGRTQFHHSGKITSHQALDCQDWPAGIYFIQVGTVSRRISIVR